MVSFYFWFKFLEIDNWGCVINFIHKVVKFSFIFPIIAKNGKNTKWRKIELSDDIHWSIKMFIGVVLASGFVRKELSFWILKISFIRETVIFDTSLPSFWTICHELYQTENLRFCQIANNYVTNFLF